MLSHALGKKPQLLVAAVALGVVHRICPHWCAIPLGAAAQQAGIGTQRLSRLISRIWDPVNRLVATVTRRGRPPADKNQDQQTQEIAQLKELLAISRSILQTVTVPKSTLRPLIVGAYLRLKASVGITQQAFCDALAICPRTLRAWVAASKPDTGVKKPQSVKPDNRSTKKRRQRRPRFGFDLVPPQTQYAGDTTNVTAFNIPLKVIASQDIGGRDQHLFESVIVDDHESAELVSEVISQTLKDAPGAQWISDQGTPYLAQETIDTLEKLDIDIAVQKEADPLGKATIERAFGMLKTIAQPLFAVSNRIADQVEGLRREDLAKAFGKLIIIALLKAYCCGGRMATRACQQRSDVGLEDILEKTATAREAARAEEKSKRLLLREFHTLYQLDGSMQKFIQLLRRYPLKVLHQAEHGFRRQAHRSDIKKRTAYFYAIVRNCFDQWQKEQQRTNRDKHQLEQITTQNNRRKNHREECYRHPEKWLSESLENLVSQVQPNGKLLFCGAGIGKAGVHCSLDRLCSEHGFQAMCDIVTGVLIAFRNNYRSKLLPETMTEIENIVLDYLKQCVPDSTHQELDADVSSAKIKYVTNNQRSRSQVDLRNYPAGCCGS